MSMTATYAIRPGLAATDKQIGFLTKLHQQRQMSADMSTAVAKMLDSPWKYDRKMFSTAIDRAVACPPKQAAEAPTGPAQAAPGLDLSSVPSGYYAVPGGDTRLKIKIDNVTEGRWAGYIFVRDAAAYGHGQRYGCQRPGQRYVGDITGQLAAIIANPRAASARYGQLTSTCGVCGRALEDKESVARGIGPVCASRF